MNTKNLTPEDIKRFKNMSRLEKISIYLMDALPVYALNGDMFLEPESVSLNRVNISIMESLEEEKRIAQRKYEEYVSKYGKCEIGPSEFARYFRRCYRDGLLNETEMDVDTADVVSDTQYFLSI